MSFSLAGKTAIVTGAANGVGLAIARHFVSEGAKVMMADMSEDKLATEADALTTDETKPKFFAGDLRQRLTLANLISATIDEFERIDILVNASRQVLRSNPLNPDEDEFENLMDQNVTTGLRLTQLVAKRMVKQAENQDTGNAWLDVGEMSLAEGGGYPVWNQENVDWLAEEWQRAEPVVERINRLLDWLNDSPEAISEKLTAVRDRLLEAYNRLLEEPQQPEPEETA